MILIIKNKYINSKFKQELFSKLKKDKRFRLLIRNE